MLTIHRRRPLTTDSGLTFKTPEEWLDEPGIRRKYENMLFDRSAPGGKTAEKIIGVGHKIFDKSLKIALEQPVSLAFISDLEAPIIVFQVFDSVTEHSGYMRQAVIGLQQSEISGWHILRDWELVHKLNQLALREIKEKAQPFDLQTIADFVNKSSEIIKPNIESFNFPFKVPDFRPLALMWCG